MNYIFLPSSHNLFPLIFYISNKGIIDITLLRTSLDLAVHSPPPFISTIIFPPNLIVVHNPFTAWLRSHWFIPSSPSPSPSPSLFLFVALTRPKLSNHERPWFRRRQRSISLSSVLDNLFPLFVVGFDFHLLFFLQWLPRNFSRISPTLMADLSTWRFS